ncbi:hypothetical protein C8239_04355 [Paracidovorax avenae]|uniref:hypothetical protein n=1 Tax=Paracidovorax avenae TaxID=80867 RepID=UPI000D2070ED|nr:hypothetical protein [Paracidovorax avenae]AVS84095.1 hypothetical protein C8239_04355 [Paracidovorax avenae]
MKINTSELIHIRKTLSVGILAMMALLGVSSYFTFWPIPELFRDLDQAAPVVRIWPGVMQTPAMLPLALFDSNYSSDEGVPLGR